MIICYLLALIKSLPIVSMYGSVDKILSWPFCHLPVHTLCFWPRQKQGDSVWLPPSKCHQLQYLKGSELLKIVVNRKFPFLLQVVELLTSPQSPKSGSPSICFCGRCSKHFTCKTAVVRMSRSCPWHARLSLLVLLIHIFETLTVQVDKI